MRTITLIAALLIAISASGQRSYNPTVDTTKMATIYDLLSKINKADSNKTSAGNYTTSKLLNDSLSTHYSKTATDTRLAAKVSTLEIKKQFWIGVDTTAQALTEPFFMGYSDGIVVDTLIFEHRRRAGSPDVTAKVWYGNDINSAGTAVVTAGNQVTSYSGPTRVSSFNNATIAKGNTIWLTFSAISVKSKGFFVTIIGHRQ